MGERFAGGGLVAFAPDAGARAGTVGELDGDAFLDPMDRETEQARGTDQLLEPAESLVGESGELAGAEAGDGTEDQAPASLNPFAEPPARLFSEHRHEGRMSTL